MRVLHVAAGNLYGGVERILEEIARHVPPGSRHEFALSFEGRLSSGLDAARLAHGTAPREQSRRSHFTESNVHAERRGARIGPTEGA